MKEEEITIDCGWDTNCTLSRTKNGYDFQKEEMQYTVHAKNLHGLKEAIQRIDSELFEGEEVQKILKRWDADEELPALTAYVDELRENNRSLDVLPILMEVGERAELGGEYIELYSLFDTSLKELPMAFEKLHAISYGTTIQDLAASFCDMLLSRVSSEKQREENDETPSHT